MNVERAKFILKELKRIHPDYFELNIVWDNCIKCGSIAGHTVEIAELERSRINEEMELATEWLELRTGEDLRLFADRNPELGLTEKEEAIQRLEEMIAEEEEMTA